MSDSQLIIVPDDEESIVGQATWRPSRAVLAQSGRFKIHATYLEVEASYTPTLNDLQSVLNDTADLKQAADWAAADAALLADRHHGEDAAALYYRWTYGTVRNMMVTARLWPKEWRVPGVDLSFHTVLNPYLREALEATPIDEAEIERLVTFLVDARERNLTRDQFAADFLANRQPPSLREEAHAEESMARSVVSASIGKTLGTARGMMSRLETVNTGGQLGDLIAEVEGHATPFIEALQAVQDQLNTLEGE